MTDPRPAPAAIFILGLTGLFFCQVLSPLAWYLGNSYMHRSVRERLPIHPLVPWGRGLGLLGTLLGLGGAFLTVAVSLITFAWTR